MTDLDKIFEILSGYFLSKDDDLFNLVCNLKASPLYEDDGARSAIDKFENTLAKAGYPEFVDKLGKPLSIGSVIAVTDEEEMALQFVEIVAMSKIYPYIKVRCNNEYSSLGYFSPENALLVDKDEYIAYLLKN